MKTIRACPNVLEFGSQVVLMVTVKIDDHQMKDIAIEGKLRLLVIAEAKMQVEFVHLFPK